MDSGEEYILEVLRSVHKNLLPKVSKEMKLNFEHVFERLKTSDILRGEIALLQKVEGFMNPALVMEWILVREAKVKHKNYAYTFAKDVDLLEEKFAKSFSVEKEIKIKNQKSLTDLIDKNMLVGFSRFTQIVNSLVSKSSEERKSVYVLLMIVAKSSIEIAKSKKNITLANFFNSIISFINFVEKHGAIESVKVAEFLSVIGEKLNVGLNANENGEDILDEINLLLSHPEEVLR